MINLRKVHTFRIRNAWRATEVERLKRNTGNTECMRRNWVICLPQHLNINRCCMNTITECHANWHRRSSLAIRFLTQLIISLAVFLGSQTPRLSSSFSFRLYLFPFPFSIFSSFRRVFHSLSSHNMTFSIIIDSVMYITIETRLAPGGWGVGCTWTWSQPCYHAWVQDCWKGLVFGVWALPCTGKWYLGGLGVFWRQKGYHFDDVQMLS